MIRSIRFYRAVGKTIWGKLVVAMVIGWLVSMYSLGITATAYMFDEVERGVLIVLPVFFIWFITMVTITWSVERWSKEAVTLSAFYHGLEKAVNEKTKELKQIYEVQLKQEQEIRRLHERLVFIAAHELRTPVTAIKWILDTLSQDLQFKASLSDEHRMLIETLHKKNQNLIYLVEDLLNIARLQNKPGALEASELYIKDIISSVQEEVRPLAETKKIALYWQIMDLELPPVKADAFALKEVLTNLLTNAIRYNKSGGWITMNAQTNETELIVQVRDSGIGMTKEEMEKLFQEFYRVKNQETATIEGTGLGLFITKQLLERMQGRIWVESTKGVGSTFSFSLPLYPLSH